MKTAVYCCVSTDKQELTQQFCEQSKSREILTLITKPKKLEVKRPLRERNIVLEGKGYLCFK